MKFNCCFATWVALIAFQMLAATGQESDSATDSPKPSKPAPFTASLLVLRSDWSKSPFADRVEADLRKAVGGVNVPRELLEKLPATGSQVMFPPQVANIYSAEDFSELLAWLQGNGLVERQSWFDELPLPKPARSGAGGAGGLRRFSAGPPKDFLARRTENGDLAALSNVPLVNNALVSQWVQLQWFAYRYDKGEDVHLRRRIVIAEQARGQESESAKEVLAAIAWRVTLLKPGEVALVNAFPLGAGQRDDPSASWFGPSSTRYSDPILRSRMHKQREHDVFIVIEKPPRTPPNIGGPMAVHLPKKVEVLTVQNATTFTDFDDLDDDQAAADKAPTDASANSSPSGARQTTPVVPPEPAPAAQPVPAARSAAAQPYDVDSRRVAAAAPFTAALVLVKADWSQAADAKAIERELRDVLSKESVPADLLSKLPASATEVLFAPEVAGHYTPEHFAELMRWLEAKGLIEKIDAFPGPGNIVLPPQESKTPDDFLLPGGPRGDKLYWSRWVTFIARPYDFLGLAPLPDDQQPRPFITREPQFRWHIGANLSADPLFNVERQIAISERGRGQGPTDAPLRREVLTRLTFSFELSNKATAVVVNAFPGRDDAAFREAARKKGFEPLLVIQHGSQPLSLASLPPGDARLRLPDTMQVIDNTTPQAYRGTRGRATAQATPAVSARGGSQQSTPPAGNANAADNALDGAHIKVFSLRHLPARDAERIVTQLFPRDIQSAAADERTNSLIVRGAEEQLNVIFHILVRLDDEQSQKPATAAAGSVNQKDPANMPPVTELASRFAEKERQSLELARQLRELQGGVKPDQAKVEKLSAELRRAVGEAFTFRQQLHQAELAQLQQRMSRIQQTLKIRASLSEQIIDGRVQDLLNPDLEWNADPAAPTARNAAAKGSAGLGQALAGPEQAVAAANTPSPLLTERSVAPSAPNTTPARPRVSYGTHFDESTEQLWPVLGLTVTPLSREEAPEPKYTGSLKITAIAADSPVNKLQVGDIIIGMQTVGRPPNVSRVQLNVLRGKEFLPPVTVEFPSTAAPAKPAPPAAATSFPRSTSEPAPPAAPQTQLPLRPASEFRERLQLAEAQLQRAQHDNASSFGPGATTPDEQAKAKADNIRYRQKQLDFVREEYAAQLRLLELEVTDAKSAVTAAQRERDQIDTLMKRGSVPQRELVQAQRAQDAAALRLERAQTILNLYRKADSQPTADDAADKGSREP